MRDHSARYPMHNLRVKDRDGNWGPITCAAAMILPGQCMIRDPPPAHLFCTGCRGLVPVEATIFAAAQHAATEEGFTGAPPAPDEPTPGMLSSDVREGLYFARLAEMSPSINEASNLRDKVPDWHALTVLGYATGGAPRALTDAGRTMAGRITDPEVDEAALRFDPSVAVPAKEKKKRPKKPSTRAVVDVMLCATPGCGHGPRSHLDRGMDAGCHEPRCRCSGYKVPKAPKKKRPAKSVPVEQVCT